MKTIDIYKYRYSSIDKESIYFTKDDTDSISKIFTEMGLVSKKSGLCAPPFNKYYSFSYRDNNSGVSYSDFNKPNVCNIIVSEASATLSKINYFYSLEIIKTSKYFYIIAFAQTKHRYKNINILDSVVYTCDFDELSETIAEIYKNIK